MEGSVSLDKTSNVGTASRIEKYSLRTPDKPQADQKTPAISSIISPPPKIEKVLNPAAALEFIKDIFGEDKTVPWDKIPQYLDIFINETNRIVTGTKSSVITEQVRDQVLKDPLSKDTLRLAFWYLLKYPGFGRGKPAVSSEPSTALEDFAATAAASNELTPTQLSVFRSGGYALEIPFSTDEKGQIKSFKVLLKIGFHVEVVAEFKDGQPPEEGKTPIARATIVYLQKLLLGAGYLNPTGGWKEGVFCKQTFNALYSFLAGQNLLGLPNVESAKQILKAKIKEASEAYDKYRAVDGKSPVDRYMRYKLAEKALDSLYITLSLAKKYSGLLPEKLSSEEKAFVEKCQEVVGELNRRVKEIFSEITAKDDGLIMLDVQSLKSKAEALSKLKGKPGEAEAFRRYVDTATAILSKLKRWQELAKDDTGLNRYFEACIKDVRSIVEKHVEGYPKDQKYANEKLQLFGQALDKLGEQKNKETTSDAKWIFYYQKAAEISDAIGNNPARGLLISFLKESLKDKKKDEIGKVFNAFLSAINKAGSDPLMQLGESLYQREVASDLKGNEAGQIEGKRGLYDASDAIEKSTDFNDKLNKLRGQVYNLLFILYPLVEEHNRYAESEAGKQNNAAETSFKEIIDLAKDVLAKLEGLSDKDVEEILEILAFSSDDPKIAKIEFAEGLEAKLTEAKIKDLNSSQSLVISPKAIRELERKMVDISILPGAVSYADIKKWKPELLPPDAKEGDYFFVSVFGDLQKVSSEIIQNGKVPLIPINNLAGKEYERNPLEFMRIEKLATLKLAIAKYVPVSDKQVLMLTGKVTGRLTALDLKGLVKVFGEGKYWIFRPGSLEFKPVETAILNKVADTIEAKEPEKAELIRRILKGTSKDTRFTAEEKGTLEKIFAEIKPEAFDNLDPFEKKDLKVAIFKINRALANMFHKNGLSTNEQKTLKDLASYLERDENLSINDARLVKDEPAPTLVEKIKKAAAEAKVAFDENKFTETYKESVRILRDLHGSLHALASKYPPEEPGFNGWGNFVPSYYKQAGKAAMEAISPPSLQDYLVVGLPNDRIFEINVFLYPELISRLAEIQESLKKYENLVDNLQLKESIGLCVNLVDPMNALAEELKTATKDLKDDAIKGFTSTFLQLVEYLEKGGKGPTTMFLQEADAFLQMTSLLSAKIKKTKDGEKDKKKIELLEKLEKAIGVIHGAFSEVRATRNNLAPDFEKKFDLEVERAQIIDKLGSDKFDAEKYERLKQKLPGILDEDIILDWVSGVFSGDQGIVIGPGGQSTKKKVRQILGEFFEKNPQGAGALSSLLPEPGENKETIIAKIALSKLFEKIPREQTLNLPKSMPVMLFGGGASMQGLFSVPRDLPAIGSRASGGVGEIDFGPGNIEELQNSTNPSYRLYYSFLSFLALSSSQYPKTNFSSQLHMLLAGSPTGHDYLSEKLARGKDNQSFRFDTVTKKDVEAFVKYLKEEIIPQIKNSPRLAKQVDYLLKTKRISIDFKDFNPDKLLTGLPEGDFKIYDSGHASKETRNLAKVLEDTLKIVGEINRTKAVEDIEVYSLAYFDPIQTIQDLAIDYQKSKSDQVDPPHHLEVIRYEDDPKAGEVEKAFDLWGIPLEVFSRDIVDWVKLYGPGILRGLREEMLNNPGGSFVEALRGSTGFAANFIFFMGKQINMGFADTWGGLGDLIQAASSGDKKLAYTALERIRDGLAHTTGAFLVFEVMPWIFYSDVIKEIEAGNYTVALGKAIAVTAMTYKSFGAIKNVIRHGVKTGDVLIKNGKIYLSNRAAQKMGAALKPYLKLPEFPGLGLKLAWYTLTPTGWVHGAYKIARAAHGVYKYYTEDLNLEISRSPLEISLAEAVKPAKTKWTKIADLKSFLTKYRINTLYQIGENGVRGLIRGVVEYLVGKKEFGERDSANLQELEVLAENLREAKTNPNAKFEIKISRGKGEIKSLLIDGKTFLELAQAKTWKQTRAVLERYNAFAGQKYTVEMGGMREIHHALSDLRMIYESIRNQLQSIEQIVTVNSFNEWAFLQEATVGKGLQNKYTLRIGDQTLEITGNQIVESLHRTLNGKPLSPIDQAIFEHFRKTVKPVHLYKMTEKAHTYAEKIPGTAAGVESGEPSETPDGQKTQIEVPEEPVSPPEPLPARSGMSFNGLGEVVPVKEQIQVNGRIVVQTKYEVKLVGATPASKPFIISGLNGNLEQVVGRNGAEFANFIREMQKLGIEEVEFRGNGKGPFSAELTPAELAELPGKVENMKNFSNVNGTGRLVVITETNEPGAKFSVSVEEVIKVTHEVFDFQTEVALPGIEVNGSFEGVEEALQRKFVEALKKARNQGKAKILIIEKGVHFGNDGKAALEKLITLLEKGKLPKKVRVVLRDGNIFLLKGNRYLDINTLSFMGTGVVQKASDVLLGKNAPSPMETKVMTAETPPEQGAWVEYKKRVDAGKIKKPMSREKFIEWFNKYSKLAGYFEKTLGIAFAALAVAHIANSEGKGKAVVETMAIFIALNKVMEYVDPVVGKLLKNPLHRAVADFLVTFGIMIGGGKVADYLVDKSGVNFNSAGWQAFGEVAGDVVDVAGAGLILTYLWNMVSTPDEERAFLDRSATGIDGWQFKKIYFNDVPKWNKKVEKEIAKREEEIKKLRAAKPRVERRFYRGEYFEYEVNSPEQVARQIKQLEAEINEWKLKYIDEDWDKRQAFSLYLSVSKVADLRFALEEQIEKSSLSDSDKKQLINFAQVLENCALDGFVGYIPDDVWYAAGRIGEDFGKNFNAMFEEYKRLADDIQFFKRIGRESVYKKLNDRQFLLEGALLVLGGK